MTLAAQADRLHNGGHAEFGQQLDRRVVERRGGRVFIEAGAGRGIWTLTTDQITKLEVSKGDEHFNRRPMIKGAAIGAPVGAVVFWGVTGIMKPGDKSQQYNRNVTAGAGLLVGAVVGAIAGHHIEKSQRGDEVQRVSVQLDNGRIVTFDEASGTDLRVGERVRIDNNRVVRVADARDRYDRRRGDRRYEGGRYDDRYNDRRERSADLQSPLV